MLPAILVCRSCCRVQYAPASARSFSIELTTEDGRVSSPYSIGFGHADAYANGEGSGILRIFPTAAVGRFRVKVSLDDEIGMVSGTSGVITVVPPVNRDVTAHPTSLLLHFDNPNARLQDSSGNNSPSVNFVNLAVQPTSPDFRTGDGFAGSDSAHFNGRKDSAKQAAGVGAANSNLSFGEDEFTVDFWVRPEKLDDNTLIFTLPAALENSGNHMTFYGRGSVALNGGLPYLQYPSGFVSGGAALNINEWNHVAIQRKNGATSSAKDHVSVAVNGYTGEWKEVDSITPDLFSHLSFGWPWGEVGANNAFQGSIDEFRVVKGKALWGDVNDYGYFIVPSAAARGVATVRSPSDVTELLVVPSVPTPPERSTLGVSAPGAPNVRAVAGAPTARDASREMRVKKVNGDRDFWVYLDGNERPVKTVFWAANTGDKKLREYEYDAEGESRAREVFYNGANEVTDIISYHPRGEGGGMRQDARWRREKDESGSTVTIKTLSEFDAKGRITYTHEYRGGALRFAKTFAYYADDNGKLATDLWYGGPNNWETNLYEYNSGGILQKITNTKEVPSSVDGATVFQTTSVFGADGKLFSATRIAAPSLSGAAASIEEVSYRRDGQIDSVNRFDFENKVKTAIPYKEIAAGVTAPEYEYAAAMTGKVIDGIAVADDAAISYTSYEYEAGVLKSKKRIEFAGGNIDRFKLITTYSPRGEAHGKEFAYQAAAGVVGTQFYASHTIRTFDEDAKVL